MALTTEYSGKLDAPTGDEELDSLLAEMRKKTGRSWQVEVNTMHPKGSFWNTKIPIKFYSLLLYVGGVMPYQVIMCGSGDVSVTKGYLIGYLSGIEEATKSKGGKQTPC
ncbi:hypothetical protein KLER11_gp39 [Pararheinheimera phage vB_PsoM_KLER1-1]|nr:hypothetical protein KLER11_gp39 [Pararheinheimera phage vB_PsoM_KLER1-1]